MSSAAAAWLATPPAAVASVIAAGARARVLVVDNNVDAAETLRDFLAAIGHDVAVAHDGAAALELARQFEPDVAVLDIGLPVMDGYELARLLREHRDGRPLQLIAVTGYGQDSDRQRARDVGFDHHLVKPVSVDTLVPLIVPSAEPGRERRPTFADQSLMDAGRRTADVGSAAPAVAAPAHDKMDCVTTSPANVEGHTSDRSTLAGTPKRVWQARVERK